MKKFLATLIVAVMTLGMVACGSINASDVAILWSGDGVVHVPNSMINAIERAMYIENVSYAHYGANDDSAKQVAQARDAVNADCAALVVELVDASAAQEIIDIAKAKNIPVVFLNCTVDATVLAGYDKCIAVEADVANGGKIQGEMIGQYIVENFESVDRNKDDKISYISFADNTSAAVDTINSILAENSMGQLEFYDAANAEKNLPGADAGAVYKTIMANYNDEKSNTVELVITDSDLVALEILVALQSGEFNTNKLKTHLIPVFTIGFGADYKEYVLSGKPTSEDAVKEYYESMRYLCDLTTVKEEDLDAMIFNTLDVISSGRIIGTAVIDYDAMAVSAAAIVRNFINGAAATEGVNTEWIDGSNVRVPYTTNTK